MLQQLVGPSLGLAGEAATTAAQYFLGNSERTNAAERKLAKTLYDLGI